MFLSLVVPNCFLWYIHDTFSWVTNALCVQGLQWAEELPQPSAVWQPFFLCYPLPKWQGRAPCWGTIPEKINPNTLALPSTVTSWHLSVHSAQGQGADETWNRGKLQILSAGVVGEEPAINGRAKMQLSFGYCHISVYVLTLQPSCEAVLLQCCHFNAVPSGPV